MKHWTLKLALILCVGCGMAQALQAPGKLEFEVASIKPAPPQPMGRIQIGMQTDSGMLRYTNVSLKECIRTAYKVKDFQIEGPDWLGSERFDITAKFPEGATEKDVPEMLKALLAERFKLTLHSESKEHNIYALVAGKNGPKLKPSENQTPSSENQTPSENRTAPSQQAPNAAPRRGGFMMMMDPNGLHLKSTSATVTAVADAISRFSERPIIDMTGIEGQYDFDLVFAPETMRGMPPGAHAMAPPPGANAAADGEQAGSIFDAVGKYGLKLEPRKAPLDVLTIDHIEKTPTEN